MDQSLVGNSLIESVAPLTSQQMSYLSLMQQEDLCESRRTPFALRISGAFEPELLRKSLEEVIRRHGSLRTRIIKVDGMLQQQVDRACEYQLRVVDISGTQAAGRETQVERFVQEAFDQKFDLAVGPLFDASLIKLEQGEYVLVTAFHHTIIDSFSKSVMFREIWLLYSAYSRGLMCPFTTLPPQYCDYAVQQHDARLEWVMKHGPYWQERLSGAERIRWPSDAHLSQTELETFASIEVEFDGMISSQLRELARRTRTRLSMVLLTAYSLVIGQWCNQRSFIVPLNIAGQHHSDHATMIGYFSQFLYLRIDLTREGTFLDLLSSISQEFCEALVHQDFDRVVLQEPEFLWGTLFTWDFWTYDDRAGMPTSAESAQLNFRARGFPVNLSVSSQAAQKPSFDTGIWLRDTAEGIRASFSFRTDIFISNSIEKFLRCLRRTVNGLATNPHARTSLAAVVDDT